MTVETIAGTAADALFVIKRFLLGAYRVRRAHVYGIGAGKSGTHSLAAMFSGTVRSRHEPEVMQLIDRILERHDGRISEANLAQWLRRRDRKLALELDSSFLNFDVLDILVREFPKARFVLAIRDCYSWLNSALNHMSRARETVSPRWIRIWNLRFRPDLAVHAPGEKALKENGFSNLDSYFSYWTARHEHVIATVPAERLLAVRTDQLAARAFEIADFAGLPRRSVRLERTHEFANPSPDHFIRRIDRGFLERKVEHHCRPLMQKFFPEIRSLDDVKL